MPYQDNIQEILLRVKAEGRGEMDGYVQGLKELHDTFGKVLARLANGDISGEVAAKTLQKVAAAARLVTKEINQLDPEFERLQATLKRMDEASSASAAEAARMRTQASRTVVDALHEQDREMAAVSAKLKEYNERDNREATEAAELRKRVTRESLENFTQQQQGEQDLRRQQASDMDAMRAKLGEYNARDRADTAEATALRTQSMRHSVDLLHQRMETDRQAAESTRQRTAEEKRAARERQAEIEYDIKQETRRLEQQKRTLEQGKEAANRFGYGILNIAHAIQDAQYGFGAVLNNIPLVVQALGGGPGLAGTVMVAGVGISVFGDHIKQAARELELIRNPAKEAAATIAQLREKIEAMTANPWKVAIDYKNIKEAENELSILEARLQAYKAELAKQTPEQEKVGKAVSESIQTFGAGEGEQGPMLNLEKIVASAAKQEGYLAQYIATDPRQAKVAELQAQRTTEIRSGMTGEITGRQLNTLRAEIEREAEGRVRSDLLESSLKGNEENLDRLITLLETATGRRLLGGDAASGILPMGKDFVESLRQSRPGAIRAVEEEEAAEKRAEESRKMWDAIDKAQQAPIKAATDREIASLVSGKAKALEGPVGEDVLKLIQLGAKREDIAGLLDRKTEARMGDVPHGKEASARILRQVTEKAYADVMNAKNPGMTDEAAAAAVFKERAEEAKAKADKADAREARILKDPVTGKPLTDTQKFILKQQDEEIRNNIEDRQRANTPQGMQQAFRNRNLMQMQGLQNQIAQARPDLDQNQVAQVANRTQQIMQMQRNAGGQVNMVLAANQAMNEIMMRIVQEQLRTRQQLQNLGESLRQTSSQQRGMQQQRPSILPSFPRR